MSQNKIEFLEAIIAADQALIEGLRRENKTLRDAVEALLNCADPDRDIIEIRQGLLALKGDTT